MTRAVVKFILENARLFPWSVQGLGMFRLYLSNEIRLHVWDSRFAVKDVSRMHTHPWHFTSWIVSGAMRNVRYSKDPDGQVYCAQLLQCGPGGCLKSESELVRLFEHPIEIYYPGDTYQQDASEIHDSQPDDGTVTLVKRTFMADKDHAMVYWPYGKEWVSAEPRKATEVEVMEMAALALSKMWNL